MGTFRVHANKNYTILNNHVFYEKGLSLKAKGLLCLMLSLPESWDYTAKGLCQLSKDGQTSTNAAIKELEEYGYVIRSLVRDEKGRVTDTNYDIYEVPVLDDTGGAPEDPYHGDTPVYMAQPEQTVRKTSEIPIPVERENNSFSLPQLTGKESIVPDSSETSISPSYSDRTASADDYNPCAEPQSYEPIMENPKSVEPIVENPKTGELIFGFLISENQISGNRAQLNTNIINNLSNKPNHHHQENDKTVTRAKNNGESFDDDDDDDPLLIDVMNTNNHLSELYGEPAVQAVRKALLSVFTSKKPVRIAKALVPAPEAQSIFKQAVPQDIESACAALSENMDSVTNRSAYAKATLYNSITSRIRGEPNTGAGDKHQSVHQSKRKFGNFEQRDNYDDIEKALLDKTRRTFGEVQTSSNHGRPSKMLNHNEVQT